MNVTGFDHVNRVMQLQGLEERRKHLKEQLDKGLALIPEARKQEQLALEMRAIGHDATPAFTVARVEKQVAELRNQLPILDKQISTLKFSRYVSRQVCK